MQKAGYQGRVMRPERLVTKKGLKICSGIIALVIFTLVLVLVVLCLTVLRPKEPEIIAQMVNLRALNWEASPKSSLNLSLLITIIVHNPNHGSFRYKNSTAYVRYREKVVAQALIPEDVVPSGRKHNVSTTVEVDGERLKPDADFSSDLFSGCFNFSSSTTLHGKVSLLKLFGIKATGFSSCDITVLLRAQEASYTCSSQVNF
ncbi:hypothetical protein Ancab_033523 [Ancistrocladus abbreviatus]